MVLSCHSQAFACSIIKMREKNSRWFAYQWLASGVLLAAVFPQINWVLALCGWGMCVYGCSQLSAQARHYGAALLFAGGHMLLTLIEQVNILPPNWLSVLVYRILPLALSLLFYSFLCLGMQAQMRMAGYGGKIEWTILIVLAFGTVLGLILAIGVGVLNQMTFGIALTLANTALVLGTIALLADLFRLQRRLAEGVNDHEK